MNMEELVKELIGAFEEMAMDINNFAKTGEVLKNHMYVGAVVVLATILKNCDVAVGYEIDIPQMDDGVYKIKRAHINGEDYNFKGE